MKKYLWPLLFSLLFLLSATSSYILYDTNVKMEKEYQAALEGAYKTIHQKEWETAALASMIELLTDEYNKLYEAFEKCCEPKTPL